MFDDFKDLIELLNRHKVKYLIIGGYAVGVHAQPRATKDLDILILPAPKNAKAVFAALKEFGAPLRTKVNPEDPDRAGAGRQLSAEDFEDADSWFMMGSPPVAVDILSSIPGITFRDAWKNRVKYKVDADSGLEAYFISRDDLIAARLAAGRPQDLVDVEAIRQTESAASTANTARRRRRQSEQKKQIPSGKRRQTFE